MKILLSWLADPYLHLLSIGMLMVWLSMHFGSDPEALADTETPPDCRVCGTAHGYGNPCPMVAARPAMASLAR